MLMADVIVDTKLTCMYISIDAMVDIRLAKLVMCLVFFTWTRTCTRNLKNCHSHWCGSRLTLADMYVYIQRTFTDV